MVLLLYNTVSYHAMLTVFDVTYVSYPFSNAKMTRSRYIIHVVAFLCETGQLYSESLEKKRAQCRSFDDNAPVMQYDALLEKQAGLSSLTYYFKVTRALERQYILLVVHFSCHTPPYPYQQSIGRWAVDSYLIGVTDREGQTARDRDPATKHLGRRERLSHGEEVQGHEDEDPLQGVPNRSGHRAQTTQHPVLQLVVEVVAQPTHDVVDVEGLLVGYRGHSGLHRRNALHGEGEWQQQQEAQDGRHCVLVSRVEVGSSLLSTQGTSKGDNENRVMSLEQNECDILTVPGSPSEGSSEVSIAKPRQS